MKNLKYIFLSLLVALSLNGFAVNWVITDEGATIKVTHFAVEKYNSPKSDTQTKAVPSRTGDNTSGVDKLYIGNDNSYPCQIAWNDVTVDGDTPSDLEDFEDKVSTILNNVPAGSSDMDSATYDPAGYESQVTVKDIQRTLNQAQALLASSGAAITAGQGYIIDNGGVTQLPTGISLMRVFGINLPAGAKGFSPNAQAYVTALSRYVPCTYDVGTNKINVILETVIRVTQSGTSDPTLEIVRNGLIGVTFTASRSDPGVYTINPSVSLSTDGTGIFNVVYVHMTGSQVQGALSDPLFIIGGYYDEAGDNLKIGSQFIDFSGSAMTPTDGVFNDTPLYLICVLSN